MSGDIDARLDQISVLAEPIRRALYRFVAEQSEPVTREQAAAEVGVALHTVKFHLDRLVDEGLLDAGYRRPPGRRGPGAGRPAKVYTRSHSDLDVSLPERHYDLAGRLLVAAIAQAERTEAPILETLGSVAIEAGRAAGARGAPRQGGQASPKVRQAALVDELKAEGYEPRSDPDGLTLSNCPFHALARQETELVCGMNLAYLKGLLDGVGVESLEARLDPSESRCCVRLLPHRPSAHNRGAPISRAGPR